MEIASKCSSGITDFGSDPPSALITVSDYDDDDDSLFNSEIDADGVIGKAIHSMEIIKSEQNQRTTDGFKGGRS
jgi:hypothetical protein